MPSPRCLNKNSSYTPPALINLTGQWPLLKSLSVSPSSPIPLDYHHLHLVVSHHRRARALARSSRRQAPDPAARGVPGRAPPNPPLLALQHARTTVSLPRWLSSTRPSCYLPRIGLGGAPETVLPCIGFTCISLFRFLRELSRWFWLVRLVSFVWGLAVPGFGFGTRCVLMLGAESTCYMTY